MRYLAAIVIALAVVYTAAYESFAFDTSGVVSSASQKPVVVAGFEYPTYLARTCSGELPALGAKTYFFGFMSPEMCTTRVFYANSYGEATDCARAFCENCTVQDITGWYQDSSSISDPRVKGGYCPAK